MSRSRILQDRLSFLGYDGRCRENLKALQALLEPAIDELLDDFYQFMRERPETRDLLPTPEIAMRARDAQKAHWLQLLAGCDLSESHCQQAMQVGRTHERIGLSLSTYLGGYCIVLNRFVELIVARYSADGQTVADSISSIQKAVFLDIDFVIESYLDAKNSAIRKILQHAELFIAEIEQIDAELASLGQDIQPGIEGLSQSLENCRGQIAQLQAMLPEGEAGQALHEQMRHLRQAFAACEENAQAVRETSATLSRQLGRLNTEVAERKNRHRLNFGVSQPQNLLSRLKTAAEALFPGHLG